MLSLSNFAVQEIYAGLEIPNDAAKDALAFEIIAHSELPGLSDPVSMAKEVLRLRGVKPL